VHNLKMDKTRLMHEDQSDPISQTNLMISNDRKRTQASPTQA